ncbi:hypothetical protein LSM04_009391 [Trypanosoma melophagium]|nr:hypothetical protein LSM04_009391 [Trypanosoma melophagium]
MCSKGWITTGKGKKPHLGDWNSSKGKDSPLWQFFQETRRTNKVNSTTSGTKEGITEDFLVRLREINLETIVTPQDFITERQLWKNDLFHICISDGLFIDYVFEK